VKFGKREERVKEEGEHGGEGKMKENKRSRRDREEDAAQVTETSGWARGKKSFSALIQFRKGERKKTHKPRRLGGEAHRGVLECLHDLGGARKSGNLATS